MNNILQWIFWILIPLSGSLSYAQTPYRTESYTSFDGLPSDDIKETKFNSKKFLSIISRRGLVYYDGYRFITMPGLGQEKLAHFFLGDTLYFEDLEGLKRLDVNNFDSKPETLVLKNYFDADPNNDHFHTLYVDRKQRIWSSDFNHIKYFDAQKKLTSFVISPGKKDLHTHISFIEISDQEIWIATEDGWYTWQEPLNELQKHPNPTLRQSGVSTALKLDERTLVYAVASVNEIIFVDLLTKEVTKKIRSPDNFQINGMTKYGEKILLHSYKNITIVDRFDLTSRLLYSTPSNIRHVNYEPEDNMIWISTDAGLKRLIMPTQGLKSYSTYSVDKSTFTSIVECHDTLWALNEKGTIWQLKDDQIEKVFDNAENWKIYSLSVVNGKVIVNTEKGIYWLEHGRLSTKGLPLIIDSRKIVKTILTPQNELWVLFSKGKMLRYDYLTQKLIVQSFNNTPEFWNDNLWNDIAIHEDGRIWLVGWMPKGFGISYFDSIQNRFVEISEKNINPDQGKFVGDYYNRVFTGHKRLYFSAFGGWNRTDSEGRITQRISSTEPSIYSNHIVGISEDVVGNVFFATAEGLHTYLKKLDKIIRITTAEGLPTNDLTNGYLQRANGDIILGVPGGLTCISPQQIIRSNLVNRLELSQIMVNGELVFVHGEKIELEKDQNNITLYFSDLAYAGMGKINYRYRLQSDEKWTEIGQKPELSFYHLSPGDYDLEVECYDNFGNTQAQKLAVKIIAHPPFTKSTIFYVLLGILLTVGIFGVNRYLLARQRKEEEYQRKIKDGEMKTLRAQMNPHFMFNTLNSINSYIVQHQTEDASRYLTSFSKLMRNILENSKRQLIPLEKEIQTLQLYLELESSRLEHVFDYTITVSKKIDKEQTHVPSMVVQPFVENAIWHGLMKKRGQGKIDIRFEPGQEGFLKIVIEDNGIGRIASDLINKKKKSDRESHGVQITLDRLRMANAQNRLDITDLYDHAGSPSGTSVQLIIKLETDQSL